MKASSLSVDDNISLLLKGPYGFGKTLAAATFALAGPVWLAYWEKKRPVELDHYFRYIIKRPDLLDRIEYDVYGATNANEYLNKLIQLAKDCRYTAIINDSVTMMTSAAVNWSLGFRSSKKNTPDKDRIMPDFDEYKVETSLVTQALDICRVLPCHVIWTCHPVPSIRIEGSGAGMKVTKVNPIVTYGSKVAGIVPGQFSEIYHFSKQTEWNSSTGTSRTRYMVSTDAVGDDFAKSNLGLKGEFEITDALFYEVWKEKVRQTKEANNAIVIEPVKQPYSYPSVIQKAIETQPTTPEPTKTWNASKGAYE
jgi:hypothetical protein